MGPRFETKRLFSTRSDRVKCVDVHETEPWFLASLYSGHVYIYNYETQNVVKSFEVLENTPVRAAKFVCRKQWIVCGCDDYSLRVYSYNTLEKIKQVEAHQDYIRAIAVHPTQPYVLSSSDDSTIKLWDWEKGWQNIRVFEGHTNYVMQIVINPKDPNTFASAALDKTIKIWNFGSETANFTLEGHEKGVNCIDYFKGSDKPYLVSGSDDYTAKVWDYSSKRCVQTLEGHSHNLSAVLFHPDLPIIITGSEDNSIKIWHSTTYQLENSLNYGMERCWAMVARHGTNLVILGFDDGSVVTKIGREEPPVSMDNNGKVIWARQSEIQTASLKGIPDMVDGEPVLAKPRDLESTQIYPQKLSHSPNGRFVALCGDGEYIIYTAMGWRNTSFGNALDFVWSADSKEFAISEAGGRICVVETKEKARKEKCSYRPYFSVQSMFGGQLIALVAGDFVEFREWGSLRLVRVIEIEAHLVVWSESGDSLAICGDGVFFVLRYNRADVEAIFESGAEIPSDGLANAFDVLYELPDTVRTGCWVGECFIYTTSSSRLHYCVGGEVIVLHHLDTPMFLLGYLPKESRVCLMDKEFNIYTYTLLLSILEFQTQIARGNVQAALSVLATIPEENHNKCARFLEAKGLKDIALQVSKDPEHKFDLAIQLRKLDEAYEIACTSNSALQWKQLGDLALSLSRIDLAMESMARADDLGGLLLILTSLADGSSLEKLSDRALQLGKNNIAFICLFLLGHLEKCVDLLVSSKRFPEAAFFSRTYLPSRVSDVVAEWKADLQTTNPKAAEALATPSEYPNLFDNYLESLEREKQVNVLRSRPIPASVYPSVSQHGLLSVLRSLQDSPNQLQNYNTSSQVSEATVSNNNDIDNPENILNSLDDDTLRAMEAALGEDGGQGALELANQVLSGTTLKKDD